MSAALFLDVENLFKTTRHKYQKLVDYVKYLQILEEKFGPITLKRAYGSQDPEKFAGFVRLLKSQGFIVRFEKDASWNVTIALDATRASEEIIIIGSNRLQLAPLLDDLQHKGKRVCVCACTIPPELKHAEYMEIDERFLQDATPEAT